MVNEDKLKELERLRAEATPGEWQEGIAGGADLVSFDGEDVRGVGCIQAISSRNLRYLIAACNAVPELIAEVRRQRKALGTFVEELEKAEEEAAGLEYRAEDAEDKLARLREVRIEGLNIVPLGPNTASLQAQLSKAQDKLARVRNEVTQVLRRVQPAFDDKLARERTSGSRLVAKRILAILDEPAGEGSGFGVGFSAGGVFQGELELNVYVNGVRGTTYLSREMWQELGRLAGYWTE